MRSHSTNAPIPGIVIARFNTRPGITMYLGTSHPLRLRFLAYHFSTAYPSQNSRFSKPDIPKMKYKANQRSM